MIQKIHKHSKSLDSMDIPEPIGDKTGGDYDTIFANTYVDMGKVDTVGFDYDYAGIDKLMKGGKCTDLPEPLSPAKMDTDILHELNDAFPSKPTTISVWL